MIIRVDQIMEKVCVEEEVVVAVQVPLRTNLLQLLCKVVTTHTTRNQTLVSREQSKRCLALVGCVSCSETMERMPGRPPKEILPGLGSDLTKLATNNHLESYRYEYGRFRVLYKRVNTVFVVKNG